MREDWAKGLGDVLAKNTLLTTLRLTINCGNHNMSEDSTKGLGDGLTRNTSLTSLSLTINSCIPYMREDWARQLGDGLAKSKSLTTVTLVSTMKIQRWQVCEWRLDERPGWTFGQKYVLKYCHSNGQWWQLQRWGIVQTCRSQLGKKQLIIFGYFVQWQPTSQKQKLTNSRWFGETHLGFLFLWSPFLWSPLILKNTKPMKIRRKKKLWVTSKSIFRQTYIRQTNTVYVKKSRIRISLTNFSRKVRFPTYPKLLTNPWYKLLFLCHKKSLWIESLKHIDHDDMTATGN